MGLFKKTTAAEKRQKERKKDAKKALRQEKKEVKKDARQDKKAARKDAREKKKDIRKDAREEKKDIRQSDLSGKEKKDAKKDIRKDKREDVKSINKDKRSDVEDIQTNKKEDVKEIKDHIKDVNRWLHIELPTTAGNKALLREDLREIKFVRDASVDTTEIEVTIDNVYDILRQAHAVARDLSAQGCTFLKNIIDEPRENWESLWAEKPKLVKWFGEVSKPKHVKDVYDRMRSVDKRLNKKITIRLHPQRDDTTSAQSMGWFAEPKTFKVFPRLIKKRLNEDKEIQYDEIASVMIHELVHLWFRDQKFEGETVYGDDLAITLAEEKARKARRSPENYEHYCLSFA